MSSPQMPSVAQFRLVFGAAGQLDRRNRTFQGEPLAPGAGPERLGAHEIIERSQGCPGQERRLGIARDLAARDGPARHQRRRGWADSAGIGFWHRPKHNAFVRFK